MGGFSSELESVDPMTWWPGGPELPLPSFRRQPPVTEPAWALVWRPGAAEVCVSVWHVSLILLTSSRPSTSPQGFSSKPQFSLFCAYIWSRLVTKELPGLPESMESWFVEKKGDHIKEGSQLAVAIAINPKSSDHLLCQPFYPVSLSLSLEYFSMWLLGRHTLLLFLSLEEFPLSFFWCLLLIFLTFDAGELSHQL